MSQSLTVLTPDDLVSVTSSISSLESTISTLSDTVNALSERVDALEKDSTPLPAPLVGATSVGNAETDFATLGTYWGPWDANSIHYSFQPSFKADYTTWAANGCTTHLALASTKWATPTANNFVTLVNSIPNDGRQHRIVMYQEPEDNMDAVSFQKVVKYLYDAIQASGRMDILIVLDLQVYWNSHKGGSSAYIFDANNSNKVYADVIGWSFWPKSATGKTTDLTDLNAAVALTDSAGKTFAISSFIMTGSDTPAYFVDIISSVSDLVTSRYAQGKVTDHVAIYWDGTNAPGTNDTVKSATKGLFSTLRALGS